MWTKLVSLGRLYGWTARTIAPDQAMLRSGKLGLPWVGHPVAWVRPATDETRAIPVAMGTDHSQNIGRNLYLAAKMLTGVRPAIGVRAMSKFTGIVAMPAQSTGGRRRWRLNAPPAPNSLPSLPCIGRLRQSYMAALSAANLSANYAGLIRDRDRDARDAAGTAASPMQ